MAPLPAAFGGACGCSRLALQLLDPAQPHRRFHLIRWDSDLLARTTESLGARRRWDLPFRHQVHGVELHQQGMDAQLLHPRRRAFDAIGIPVPERGAEVGMRRLLGPGDGIKQVAGQVGGADLPQTYASPASPAPRPPPSSGSPGPPR